MRPDAGSGHHRKLRAGSYNRALLGAAAQLLPTYARLETWDGVGALPVRRRARRQWPSSAAGRLRERLAAADAVLIATPEYNASLPGGLKNALDWGSWPFPNNALCAKAAAVVGALFGAVRAQVDAGRVLKTMGARVVDRELPLAGRR